MGGLVLGSEAFARQMQSQARANRREQPQLKGLNRPVAWSRIISALERLKGETWAEFRDRHGDWGRDAALWLGRRAGRLPLKELGELAGGLDYAVVSKALARFTRRLAADESSRRRLAVLQTQLSKCPNAKT